MNGLKNCITGGDSHLIDYLSRPFQEAKSVDIIVSFLMESGVKLLKDELNSLIKRNIPLRILTGNYLNITQPSALYLLKDLMKDRLDLRFYNVKNKSFHPKAYIFNYEDYSEIFIGSSNMSKSALTTAIEWNYRIDSNNNKIDFNYFKSNFEDLFLNHSIIVDDKELRKYSKSWKRPKINVSIEDDENEEIKDNMINLYQPRGAQIEALYELKKSKEEGFTKGLIVAATGIGKTYLAAFDSLNYEKILFVAHRQEILIQAQESFKNIRPHSSTGFFYNTFKDTKEDMIFATIQTLGKELYLNEDYFKADYFDYIVIDEFHHAAADSYCSLIDYFKPKFLLGLTATPERLDNKDVFSICDYNTVYEIRFAEAINKGWLVPFRYYGIFDEFVDYRDIPMVNGRYNEKKLEQSLMINKRADLILNHYRKYNSKRSLAFCSSRAHAEYMTEFFNNNGIKSCVVISDSKSHLSVDRKEAVLKLKNEEIQVIFSVDMFNEGVDIPELDMVMLLRPTESPTVFLQQLGRGLRKHRDKRYLNILDFIGNFKNANMIPFLLTGNQKDDKRSIGSSSRLTEDDFPEDCIVDFDFKLIDLFKKMDQEAQDIKSIILEEYFRIKNYIGHRPSRLDIFIYMDNQIYSNMKRNTKLNILNDYLSFLNINNETNTEEKGILDSFAHEFINMIEKTMMSQLYKMPLLLAFYNNGDIRLKINDEDIYSSFKDFYSDASNSIDLIRNKSTKDFKTFDRKDYLKLAENPKNAFLKTHGEFFYRDENYYCLNTDLQKYIKDKVFIDQVKDAIDYRTKRFYKERLEKRNENL